MKKWYQHPMVWLLITFPMLAVIGGVITINLAIMSDDGLVVDDYYRKGLGINQDLARDRYAKTLALYAQLQLAQDQLSIVFQATTKVNLPAQLNIQLMHATRKGQDQDIALKQTSPSRYGGKLDGPLGPGTWLLQLGTKDWRIQGKLKVPGDGRAVLFAVTNG